MVRGGRKKAPFSMTNALHSLFLAEKITLLLFQHTQNKYGGQKIKLKISLKSHWTVFSFVEQIQRLFLLTIAH